MSARFLLRLLPAAAAAALLWSGQALADSYSAGFSAGEIVASADAGFTEATVEKFEFAANDCGNYPEAKSCSWEVELTLSSPESRCDSTTPQTQAVYSSGPQAGDGQIAPLPFSFPLEGCRGQTLALHYAFHLTYDESGGGSPWRITGAGYQMPLFTFGYHPVEEDEQLITEASPPAALPPFEPNFEPQPPAFAVAADCRTLTIGPRVFTFSFRGFGCPKATRLAGIRVLHHRAPSGYACRRRKDGGSRCWRRNNPAKYVEWRRG
ncbi:MAG: hypothetical protein ACM3Q9_00250 [Methanosarcina sp.]